MGDVGEYFRKKERAEELSHGGLVKREGDMVTLGDGSRWWLNGQEWARQSADATIRYDTTYNLALNVVVPQPHNLSVINPGLLN